MTQPTTLAAPAEPELAAISAAPATNGTTHHKNGKPDWLLMLGWSPWYVTSTVVPQSMRLTRQSRLQCQRQALYPFEAHEGRETHALEDAVPT